MHNVDFILVVEEGMWSRWFIVFPFYVYFCGCECLICIASRIRSHLGFELVTLESEILYFMYMMQSYGPHQQ